MANIRAYNISTGLEIASPPFADRSAASGVQAAVGDVAVLDIAVDDAGYEFPTQYVIPSIPNVAISLTGTFPGTPTSNSVTLNNVTSTPHRIWLKAFSASATSATLVLPQPTLSTVSASVFQFGNGTDSGTASDSGAMVRIARLVGKDTGTGVDSGTQFLVVGGAISLNAGKDTGAGSDNSSPFIYIIPLAGADTGIGSDLAAIQAIVGIQSATDTGRGTDAGSISYLLPAPALTALTATDGGFTVNIGTVAGAISYMLEYTLNTDTNWASPVSVLGGTAGLKTVTGLTNGSLYKVRAACSSNGIDWSAYSASQTVTPAAGGSTTYYLRNEFRAGGAGLLALDQTLGETNTTTGGERSSIDTGRQMTISLIVSNSEGTGTSTPLANTTIGTTSGASGTLTLSPTSFTTPSVGATDYLLVRIIVSGSAYYWSLPQGQNFVGNTISGTFHWKYEYNDATEQDSLFLRFGSATYPSSITISA